MSINYLEFDSGWDINLDHSPMVLTISDKIIEKENNPIIITNLRPGKLSN